MDPRLRTAVDASRRWYDDVFALHGIPVRVERGLWSTLGRPPPFHSAAKTLIPGVETVRAVRAVDAFEHCSVADSFGDLELDRFGFDLLFEATWVHRVPSTHTSGTLPAGWSLVDTEESLAEWSVAHDYEDVLPPRCSTTLASGSWPAIATASWSAAASHIRATAMSASPTPGARAPRPSPTSCWQRPSALHPGQAFTDYEQGAELDALLAAGFTALGPQRVWVR